MPLESASTIDGLDNSWPLNTDNILEGDDHLRLIKAVLQTQFPGEVGDGFAIPIIATETEINYLTGLTGNVQDQIDAIAADDALVAPSGTVMLFKQQVPPVGWTQDITGDNSMIRLVTANGGDYGGADSPITLDYSHIHGTGDHVLTMEQMPSHDHDGSTVDLEYTPVFDSEIGSIAGGVYKNPFVRPLLITPEGGGEFHNHGNTTPVTDYPGDWTPKYANVIAATKD